MLNDEAVSVDEAAWNAPIGSIYVSRHVTAVVPVRAQSYTSGPPTVSVARKVDGPTVTVTAVGPMTQKASSVVGGQLMATVVFVASYFMGR